MNELADHKIPRERLQPLPLLQIGQFGMVHKGIYTEDDGTKTEVAIKIPKLSKVRGESESIHIHD